MDECHPWLVTIHVQLLSTWSPFFIWPWRPSSLTRQGDYIHSLACTPALRLLSPLRISCQLITNWTLVTIADGEGYKKLVENGERVESLCLLPLCTYETLKFTRQLKNTFWTWMIKYTGALMRVRKLFLHRGGDPKFESGAAAGVSASGTYLNGNRGEVSGRE